MKSNFLLHVLLGLLLVLVAPVAAGFSDICKYKKCYHRHFCVWRKTKCPASKECIKYRCDIHKGCVHEVTDCPKKGCKIGTCHKDTGKCSYVPKTCQPGGNCVSYKCVGDDCKKIVKGCPKKDCQVGRCDHASGNCSYDPITCPDDKECIKYKCVGDGCKPMRHPCPPRDCHTGYCNKAGHCIYRPIKCPKPRGCIKSYTCDGGKCSPVFKDCPVHKCFVGTCKKNGRCIYRKIKGCGKPKCLGHGARGCSWWGKRKCCKGLRCKCKWRKGCFCVKKHYRPHH